MKVFLAGTCFWPSYGGPAYSVSRLASALAAAGVEVGLWAPDGSASDSPLITHNPMVLRMAGEAPAALDDFGRPDLLHDNGLWRRHNHQLARLAMARSIPRVVSTRGMLEPWAMNHKKWKKRLALHLYQRRDLDRAAVLHATAESEASQLRDIDLRNVITIIPNGVDVPEVHKRELPVASCPLARVQNREDPERWHYARARSENRRRTALYLGRLQSKKGLPMLVEAWARVRPTGWCMRVIGPDEDGHRAELERLVQGAGLGKEWSFSGSVEGEAKWTAFCEADLFILPTHSENFGIAVAEALAAGVPVISTKGAPWEGLLAHGCGWWTDVSSEALAQALQEACMTDTEVLRAMGQRGREWMKRDFGWDGIAKRMIAAYKEVLGR